jgi:hypothetical protein
MVPRYLPAISPLSPRYLPAISPLSPRTPAVMRLDFLSLSRAGRQMPMRLVLVVALLVLGGCAHIVPIEYADRTVSTAIPDPQTTALGRQSNKFVAKHPAKQSGFLLLDKGEEALLWRGMLADRATRTIDAQYFIWNQDNVGTIAAERLLRAAERGVRVRVIVDELTLDADPRFLALLNAHPLVEIRLYNPVGTLGWVQPVLRACYAASGSPKSVSLAADPG